MSLAERLVLLHLAITAVLLVVLGLVMAVQHGLGRVTARRADRAARAPQPARQTQVVRVLEPRVIDVRTPQPPRVAGAARRSS